VTVYLNQEINPEQNMCTRDARNNMKNTSTRIKTKEQNLSLKKEGILLIK